MKRWRVNGIPGGRVAGDGSHVTVKLALEDGRERELEVSYSLLDGITQALLALSAQALDQMQKAGVLHPAEHGQPAAMVATGVRVQPNTISRDMIVHFLGRSSPTAAVESGSVQLSVELARGLQEHLASAIAAVGGPRH